MKFFCDKALLTSAVTNVTRVIPAKSSIPALEGVQIKAYLGKLKLTGYDMEAGITTTIDANIQKEGEIVLSARLFADMLRKMDGEQVMIETGEKYMTKIQCGLTEYTILGTPSDEFPELPSVEKGAGVELEQSELKSMIDQTLFAVAQTDTKPIHTGVLFEIDGSHLSVVAVDGFRLALRKAVLKSDEKLKFVVPGKTLGEIGKMLDQDSGENVSVTLSKRHIVFQVGTYSIVSRLLEGDFLDYKNSIPTGAVASIKISTRSFIDSVERVSLLINDRLRSPLRILFEENQIKISCSTSIGKSSDEIACEMKGEKVEIGFNNKYLLDALRAAGCDEVLVEIGGPLSPIKILPPQGDSFVFLVLPVRLKNEA